MHRTHILTLTIALALGVATLTMAPLMAVEAPAGSTIGAAVEDFTLPKLSDGSDVTFSSYKGKVVLLSFWASWCGPCRRELPAYNKTYETYKDKGFEIVAISVDRDTASAQGFIDKLDGGVNYTLLLDAKSMVMGRFDIVSMPTSFLIGPDGKVLHKEVGFSDEKLAEMEKKIEAVLAAK